MPAPPFSPKKNGATTFTTNFAVRLCALVCAYGPKGRSVKRSRIEAIVKTPLSAARSGEIGDEVQKDPSFQAEKPKKTGPDELALPTYG